MPSQEPERQYKVGDRVTVSLSGGRLDDGVVKAIINRTDGVGMQVDYGKGRDGAGLLMAGSSGWFVMLSRKRLNFNP